MWDTIERNRSITAWFLIGLGIVFLIGRFLNLNFGGLLWPMFVIAPGAAFLYAALNGGRGSTGLIFPGLIIGGTGLILMYQNLTGHWESWAYLWALYPALVGVGLVFQGERQGNLKEADTGRSMIRYSLLGCLGFALFFELLIFSNFGGLAWLLVGAGAFLLLRERGSNPYEKRKLV